jgi:eukaryotic-like serine/threonine-protein kinase
MASSHRISRRTFLANLRQSGLVSAGQLEAVEDRLRDAPNGRAAARSLIDAGLLTRFQARQLLAGRTGGFFLDRYRILDQIGQGGMGRVYKAEHQTLGRVVALKVLAPGLVKTRRARELFRREVRAAAVLVHPHIVTAFDANQVGRRCYLVMEYVNGPNLFELVRDRGPLPAGLACELVRQVALGLQHAHEKGMVHRDIKPGNLLLHRPGAGAAGLVKISDFGLARLNDQGGGDPVGTILTRQNAILGTPDYLSPEQARCLHQTDIRSDLYSLGCTFYYLLTGRVPFPGGSPMEKLVRHSTEQPAPITELRPAVPPVVTAVVQRLMAKKPEERFQTPAELAEALEPFAAGPRSRSGVRRVAPPAAATDSQPVLVAPAVDDGLAPTLTTDSSPTPVSAAGSLSSRLPAPRRRPGRRLRQALLWTFGIGGGLLAAGSALGLLLAGR